MATSFSPVAAAELQALLGTLPDAVLTCDNAGNVEFLNQAAERLTGRAGEAAVGRALAEVLPLWSEVDGTPLENPAITCLRAGTSLGPFEAGLPGRNETARRVVGVSAAPRREADGSITGVILVARDVTHAHQVAQQLSHQATHDPLTNLVNRTEFERRLTRALAGATGDRSRHALGFLDLDGFKQINDTCGHQAGDELLQELSRLLRTRMRARDTLARLGGDEFGILLEHCSPARAVRIAEQIRRAVTDQPYTCGGRTFRIGASIGIVPVHNGGSSPARLIAAADGACYHAKRQGGNRVQLSDCGVKKGSAATTRGWPDYNPPREGRVLCSASERVSQHSPSE